VPKESDIEAWSKCFPVRWRLGGENGLAVMCL